MVVNDDKIVNAMASFGVCVYCFPGEWSADLVVGTVIVFTGILPIAKSEEGLAAIIGHGEHSPTPLVYFAHTTVLQRSAMRVSPSQYIASPAN